MRLVIASNINIVLFHYVVISVGVERVADHLTVRGLLTFSTGPKWACKAFYGTEGCPSVSFIYQWNNHIASPLWVPLLSHAIWNAERKLKKRLVVRQTFATCGGSGVALPFWRYAWPHHRRKIETGRPNNSSSSPGQSPKYAFTRWKTIIDSGVRLHLLSRRLLDHFLSQQLLRQDYLSDSLSLFVEQCGRFLFFSTWVGRRPTAVVDKLIPISTLVCTRRFRQLAEIRKLAFTGELGKEYRRRCSVRIL